MKIYKNPFFYLTVVLATLLTFQVYQLVQAYSQPTAAPIGGDVKQPLDTSSAPQTKAGDLTVNGAFTTRGDLNIGENTKPTVWFKVSGNNTASIYYSGTKLMAKNGSGIPFELGAGGGESLWQKMSGSDIIFYDKGNVEIVSQTGTRTVYYYEATGDVVTGHPNPRLICDKNEFTLDDDCGGSVRVGETAPASDVAYDWYDSAKGFLETPSFGVPRAHAADSLAKVYQLVAHTETTVFKNNKLIASDIDLVNPKWALGVVGTAFYNAGDGPRLAPVGSGGIGSGKAVLSVIIDRSSRCPNGQFVVGVQLREWGGALSLGVECTSF